ncbi:MAG: hypothetical protein HQL41_09910 [Alphaproteobacteria bacterium]|nr:hypothetical protein [Alphaproteobacteria bacterium]
MATDMRIVGERRASRWVAECLDAMRDDPERVRAIAARHLDLLERNDTCGRSWIERWRGLLKLSPDEIASIALAETDEGQGLRATAPFPGVLDNARRWAIHREIGP